MVSFPVLRLAGYAILFVVEKIEFAIRTALESAFSSAAEIRVHF
jgi:hypothetical protein